MKVIESAVTKLHITEIDGLDPLTVILENHELGRGKIIIECYGESWASYWGAMGGRTIEQFFCDCDEHYLAKNLSSVRSDIIDTEGCTTQLRKRICELRQHGEIGWIDARDAYDRVGDIEDIEALYGSSSKTIQLALGDEPWHNNWPTQPNPRYVYLCLIITTIQSALREREGRAAA